MDNQQKIERAKAIANSVINSNIAIAEALKRVPKYKSPRIAKAYRLKKDLAMVMVWATKMMGAIQIATIASQPVPMFPLGGSIAPKAYIDEGGPEYINLDHFKNI